MLDEKEKQGKDVMKRIVNEEALWILESIVEARKCRPYAMFHEDTSNHCSEGLRFTVKGFDHDHHRVYFSVKGHGIPAVHNTRAINKDGEGEYFTFRGVKYHAWQFMTWAEYAAIQEDFFAHYRIIDSHVPDVRQNFGSVPGAPRFEDALVSSGLPYGDGVDA